jgi:hypothetical protein
VPPRKGRRGKEKAQRPKMILPLNSGIDGNYMQAHLTQEYYLN